MTYFWFDMLSGKERIQTIVPSPCETSFKALDGRFLGPFRGSEVPQETFLGLQ